MLGVLTALLLVFGLIKMYLDHAITDKPYIQLNKQAHFATHSGKNTITVGREFEITRRMDFHITRELARCVGGSLIVPKENDKEGKPKCKDGIGTLVRVELEDSNLPYDPDRYKVHRVHVLPALEPGVYYLLNKVCWEENFLRPVDCINLEPLEVEIFPEQYGDRPYYKPRSRLSG